MSKLCELARHVQDKAAKEDDDTIANFPEIRLACILLLSKIATTSKHKPNSLPKHAFVDFLDVLLHAELFRLRVVERVDLALNTWNVYFTAEKPEEALPAEDVRKFDEIIKRKDEWRLIYFKILQKTIALDLYYLSISKPWFASDFMVRLLEYNPQMFKSTNDFKPSPRNFIHLLTPDEMNQIKDTTKKSLKHIKDSCEWLEKSFASDIMAGLYSEEFQEAHPPPTDIQRLDSLLYFYLKNISRDYKTVTTLLS